MSIFGNERIPFVWVFIFISFFLFLPVPLWSQARPNDDQAVVEVVHVARMPRPAVTAVRIDEPIVIDGHLDEPAWRRARPATGFIQQVPNEGRPATQKTEVYILYDHEMLYFGFICYETDPSQIQARDYRRDFQHRTGDYIGISLDTYRDKHSGFVFITNPLGAKEDFQFAGEGMVRNPSWDGVWFVKTSRNDRGWIAEIGIPFKTLRYRPGHNQTWGLNFARHIARTGEHLYWAPLPKGMNALFVSLAGELRGLDLPPPGRNLQIKPFTVGQMTRLPDTGHMSPDLTGGLDVKYSITSGLTLDVTFHTDFSHVEVDTQQVNLTRFPLFFPEKRDFFLETTDAFRLIPSGYSRDVIPFFSRRIGLSEGGRPVPVVGGVRLAGRPTLRTQVGFLVMRTGTLVDDPVTHETVEPADFFVGRVRHEFGRSGIGAMTVLRRTAGAWSGLVGVDGEWKFLRFGRLVGYWLKSRATGVTPGRDEARYLEFGWRGPHLTAQLSFLDLQERFRADVGFIPRPAVRKYAAFVMGILQPKWRNLSWLDQVVPTANLTLYQRNPDHELETFRGELSLSFVTPDIKRFTVAWSHRTEQIERSFHVGDLVILPGRYTFRSWRFEYTPSLGQSFAPHLLFQTGGYWDGHLNRYRIDLTWFRYAGIRLGAFYERNDIDLPRGEQTLHLSGVRLSLARSTSAFFDVFVQYHSVAHRFIVNARLDIIHRPLSHLYLTYNEIQDVRANTTLDRVLALKFEYLFAL